MIRATFRFRHRDDIVTIPYACPELGALVSSLRDAIAHDEVFSVQIDGCAVIIRTADVVSVSLVEESP